MLTAAQKAKKSLSAWSLATKLTASHISLSNKQKKPSTEETRENESDVWLLYVGDCQLVNPFPFRPSK